MFQSTGYFIRICIYINSSSAMSDSFFNLHCVVVVANKLLYRPRHEEISHGRRTYTIILDKTFIDFSRFRKFLFTTNEAELDYLLSSESECTSCFRISLTTSDLRKLGNFKKILEILWFDSEYPPSHPKGKFWHLC